MMLKNIDTGEYTLQPKFRVGDYVEWESPMGIYVGMIRSFNYQNSIAGGVQTWYEINSNNVQEENILTRLLRESDGSQEQ